MTPNPQSENGHVRINEENVEHFAMTHLSGNEWQVLWVVLRKTWGWHKKEDAISITQFQKATKLSRPSVTEALDKLVGKKVLVVKKQAYVNIYGFNKLYNQWVVPKKELVGFSVRDGSEKGTRVVPKKEPKLVPKKEHTINKIDTNTKDTIQKIGANRANALIAQFKEVNPSFERMFSNKTERACASRLIEKYGYEKMSNLLKALPDINGRPYAPIITTPYQLEVNMGKLLAFLKQDGVKNIKHSVTKV